MTPDEFLRAYHARHPGATALAFADGRCADGRSSYQLLADLPRAGERILDLGCGDGHLLELLVRRGCRSLVGLDMSPEELAGAAARPALAGVKLALARGQALPLAAGSLDWVLSHLAFMLMSDIETVVAELCRVLRPGGRFAAVVGGGPALDGAGEDGFALYLRLFRDAYDAIAEGERAPRIGDRRTREAGGFAALFHPESGFDPAIEETEVTIRLDAGAERVWDILSSMYEMLVVPAAAQAALRQRFLVEARALAGREGLVPCAMRCRLLVATRARAT